MTEPLALRASSGHAQIDQITVGAITIFETHFPNRISGYYFQGSCADQAITSLSDIDLHVVYRTPPETTEQQDFAILRTALKQRLFRTCRGKHTFSRLVLAHHKAMHQKRITAALGKKPEELSRAF